MQPTVSHSLRSRTGALLIALFLAALGAPWVDQLVRADEARSPELCELRRPAPRPPFVLQAEALWRYPEACNAWFNDTFGLRDVLLRWHSLQCLELFGTSPSSRVLLGRDEWMFYTGDQSIPVWRGLLPLSEGDLRLWVKGLQARSERLAAQGIAHLFVIAPNKESIYPDFLPRGLEQVGPTRFDQLAECLARVPDFDFLDLRPALLAQRVHDRPYDHLYAEEGSHWNGRGSLCAYREIMARLAERFPALAPLPASEMHEVVLGSPGETWGTSMYVADLRRGRETTYRRPQEEVRSRTVSQGLWGPGRRLVREVDDPALPRAVLIHDSFGPYVENQLAEHFSHLACLWTYDLDLSSVRAERPDVVIELWVERALFFHPPRNLTPRSSEPAELEFKRARKVLWKLDPAAAPPALEAGEETRLENRRDTFGTGIAIRAAGPADTLYLPPLPQPVDGRLLVHLEIDAPFAGDAYLLYLMPGDTEYRRQRNCILPLIEGRNDLYFALPETGVTGKLRFRPPFEAGSTFVVRAFELRAGTAP